MLKRISLLLSTVILSFNAKQKSLHLDIGGYLGLFQATENNTFSDHAGKKFTFNSEKQITTETSEHNCNIFCNKFKPKKQSIYGGSFGIFYDISKLISFGIEGNLSWHKINIDDMRNSYRCTNQNCDITNKDTLFGNIGAANKCKELFFADRYYAVSAADKVESYTYRIISGMITAKFFFQNGLTYLKVGVGFGEMSYKGPIMIENSTDHKYTLKILHLKKGLAFKVAMHTFISPKTTIGLEFYNQSNKSKDNITKYRTNAITIGFYSNL